MNALPALALSILISASPALAQAAAPAPKEAEQKEVVEQTVDVIGIIPRKVERVSPIASAKLTLPRGSIIPGQLIKVHLKLVNKSDRTISYSDPLVVLELRDQKGNLAPETELGCSYHFFSPCHTGEKQPVVKKRYVLYPHAEEDSAITLNALYNLKKPGKYSLVGYVCGLKDGADSDLNVGPECFQTKKLKLKVSGSPAADSPIKMHELKR